MQVGCSVDAKGYRVDVKGYSVDDKGYRVDVRPFHHRRCRGNHSHHPEGGGEGKNGWGGI
eukprot:184575-Prorocentrum_minimum.AAC.1